MRVRVEGLQTPTHRSKPMLAAITVTVVIVAALGAALRSERSWELIARRPYNNRYNDASGAREDHLG
jgi:hypothetical protein